MPPRSRLDPRCRGEGPAGAAPPPAGARRGPDLPAPDATEPDTGTARPPDHAAPERPGESADRLVAEFMSRVRSAGRRGAAWASLLRDVEGIGQREMLAISEVSRQMSSMQLDAISGSLDSGSVVGRGLRDLRAAVESVDPSRFDLARRGGRLLGIGPRANRLDAYLARYERAQGRIREIVTELVAGRAELERQNAIVGAARRSLATEVDALRGYAALAERLEAALASEPETAASTPPPAPPESGAARATVPDARRRELVLAARRRREEIVTQLAIAMQGYAALEIVETNNRELIHSVDTATSSTLAALRTGVVVAQALATRERLAENLRQAQEATAAAVASAGAMRSARDHAASGSDTTVADVDALRRAWAEVFVAIGAIDRDRERAAVAAAAAERELRGYSTKGTPEDR